MTVIPRDDPAQALRIRRFFIALAAYGLWLILILYSHYLGLIRLSVGWTAILYGGFIAINVIFYILFRTGLNKKLTDPSLTAPQMVAATLGALLIIYFTDEIRALFLLIYFMTFIFGVFRFSLREFLSFALFTFCSYALLVLLLFHNHPEQMDARIEILQLLIFGTVLFWFSLVGSYISSLRNRLSTTNHELSHALKTIEDLAIHDDLTQAYNRRQMHQELQRAKSIADRTGTPFSIAVLDLDHFKQVNDTFGHQKGDDVLKHVVNEINTRIRESDIIARCGGEEFIVIMIDTDIAGAGKCAQKIHNGMHHIKFPGFPDSFSLTISIGITTYRPVEAIDDMIFRADKALYRAKANGRDRVEVELPESGPITGIGPNKRDHTYNDEPDHALIGSWTS